MSWFDFGHRKDNFEAYLPDGKKTIDTGYLYQELLAIGGWYYAPVKGSGWRRFYNRWYINPSKDDVEFYGLGEEVTAFINLSKTKFGMLTIKVNGSDKDIDPAIIERWQLYIDHITHKAKNSYSKAAICDICGRRLGCDWYECTDIRKLTGIDCCRSCCKVHMEELDD